MTEAGNGHSLSLDWNQEIPVPVIFFKERRDVPEPVFSTVLLPDANINVLRGW